MRENTADISLRTPSSNSVTSSKSGRSSKQAFKRSCDLQTMQRQTIMTPLGFKTVRIYTSPEEERNSLRKYRPRPKTAPGITTPMKTLKNTLSPPDERLLKRASSANELSLTISEASSEGRPSTASSVTSSNRSVIFNSRHPSCSPTNLYRHDNVRAQARKNHPRSRSCSCEECSSVERYNSVQRRRTRSAETVDRYGQAISLPSFMKGNKFLTHEELDMGQKQYIWGMARVYSVDQLKGLKQRQYQSVLNYEYLKRVTSRGVEEKDRIKLWKEYTEYQKLLDSVQKEGPSALKRSFRSKRVKPHSHAKKHEIVGWTTNMSDDDVSIRSSSNENASESQSAVAECETEADNETEANNETEADWELLAIKTNKKARPKSSKFKSRDTKIAETESGVHQNTRNMISDNTNNVDETLSKSMEEQMRMPDDDENFI